MWLVPVFPLPAPYCDVALPRAANTQKARVTAVRNRAPRPPGPAAASSTLCSQPARPGSLWHVGCPLAILPAGRQDQPGAAESRQGHRGRRLSCTHGPHTTSPTCHCKEEKRPSMAASSAAVRGHPRTSPVHWRDGWRGLSAGRASISPRADTRLLKAEKAARAGSGRANSATGASPHLRGDHRASTTPSTPCMHLQGGWSGGLRGPGQGARCLLQAICPPAVWHAMDRNSRAAAAGLPRTWPRSVPWWAWRVRRSVEERSASSHALPRRMQWPTAGRQNQAPAVCPPGPRPAHSPYTSPSAQQPERGEIQNSEDPSASSRQDKCPF